MNTNTYLMNSATKVMLGITEEETAEVFTEEEVDE